MVRIELVNSNHQMPRTQKTIRLGLFGSIIFGAVLVVLGYLLKDFLGGTEGQTDRAQTLGSRFGLGMMIFGAVIVVGNLLWVALIIVVAKRKPPMN